MTAPGGNTTAGYLATIADLVIVTAAVVSVALGSLGALIVWEAAAVIYLMVGGLAMKYLTAHGVRDNRVGTLDTLSWIFPLAASLAGANAAILALVSRTSGGLTVEATVGILGIPLSWLLLHVGFSNMYASAFDHALAGGAQSLRFPGESTPGPVEFLYLAMTVGATFATSDVEIRTRSMRLLVVAHCVISFFYNALVVAAAFQVLQRLAGG